MKAKQFIIFLFAVLIIFMTAPVGEIRGDSAGTGCAGITFQHRPKANFSCFPQTGYPPLIVTFTNTSKGAGGCGGEIKWTLVDYIVDEGAFDDADEQFVYIYKYPGTYPMYLSATNAAGTDIVVKYITVLDPGVPSVPVEFVAAPRAGPVGATVQFYNVSPQFNSVACDDCKYLWDFGDGTSSTDEDPTHEYTVDGLHTVSLTIFGMINAYYGYNYYTETKVNFINIFPASPSMLSADFVASPVTGAFPHAVQFSNLTGGEAENILWDFGDGSASEEANPAHVYSEPGRYTVTLNVDGEEISKYNYVNILSPIEGTRCPMALLLNNDEAQLSIIRNFRDQILNQTLAGRALNELYYTHALELVSIFLANEELAEEAGNLLLTLLPGLQTIVNGETMTINSSQVEAIIALLGKIADQASPGLGEVIALFISELQNGQFLEGIGIIVSAD